MQENERKDEPDYAAPLPVWDLRDELRQTWNTSNRLVLSAPTGSGKTTQICQMILQDGRNNEKQIVVLQPRRVAARTVARRVAQEMHVEVGHAVGYQVRFEDAIAPDTRIAFVTEGILLRWLQDEPTLPQVGAILFDEFHERNLLSDISLALCKALQAAQRPDLLLMVMSATLNSTAISDYLDHCPTLEAHGRAY
ncbi:MAG TPA: DEAD/DEAH box helicase, partial [Anaerolineae bacterium]